ncbi:MAG: outer membrane lipoprotein-sorting protein [Candidatus Aadella gelida]|nr:outer membrane lipoprotein-sorting protein [Candidatus Aadella gelida]
MSTRQKSILILTVVAALLMCNQVSFAEDANEIVKKADHAAYYKSDSGRADVTMEITDSLGRTRNRKMAILRLDVKDGAEQKFYVYFHEPNDVKGMSYLVWKQIGKDDDRWLYLPAMDLVRRVSASDKRSSFVGTNFVYEDISGRGTEEDEHSLLEEEDGKYKIKSVPKDLGSVEFSYFISWIDKSNYMPVKAEYYDKQGKLYRTIEAVEVKDIKGYPTITKMKATDLNSGGNTVSEFSNVDYDIDVEENIFTERFLRRPPRKYIEG